MNSMFKRVTWWVAMLTTMMGVAISANAKSIENEVFYFVVTDRFANGDKSNDQAGLQGDRSIHGTDPTDSHYFHGGDLKGLQDKLLYLKFSGVTALWITPPFKNKYIQGTTAGYHGYWATDYTQIDPHWGTNQEFSRFVKRAHKFGIKVFLDVVVNHTADVIKYEECHNADGSLKDGLNNCPFQDTAYSPFIPAGEETSKSPAWLNDPQYYNNRGDSTFSGDSSVYGDFFGLDDLDTSNPAVVEGMTTIFKNWITDFKIDGFRVDTIKHVDQALWKQWVPAIEQHAKSEGIKDFFIFGEMFDGNPANLSKFTRDAAFPSVLDFGLYYAIKDVVADTQGTDRLAWLFGQDDLYTTASSNANQLMNFVSNHDVGRIGQFISSMPNIGEDEKLSRAKLAQSLLFLSRGVPVVYYGDEQGFTGDGGDADAREDMFASQVANYNDNNLIGTDQTTADSNFNKRHPLYRHQQYLSTIYRLLPELKSGKQFVRHSQSTPGIFAISKYDPNRRRESLVLFNTSVEEQTITLDVMAKKYVRYMPFGRSVKASDGRLTVSVPPLSTIVLRALGKLKKAKAIPTATFANLTDEQTISGLQEVAVTLDNIDTRAIALHQVHFSVSVNGSEYTSLGTDFVNDPDTHTYKVYFDTSELPDGTKLTFQAQVDNYANKSNTTTVTVEKRIEPGMKIVFKKPSDWSTANIYFWNAEPQSNADWPGIAMTQIQGDWYEFQFSNDVKQGNIIFNDGNGNQTSDLFREGDGCYIDENWHNECEISSPGLKVQFKKPDGWGDSINVHYWNAEPATGTDWPGVSMTQLETGEYEFQFPDNVFSANLIFNDGNGNQTIDIFSDANGCYVNDSWQDSCAQEPPTSEEMTVYIRRPLSWNVPNIYYWNTTDTQQAATPDWPGIEMKALGDDWYSYTFPAGISAANLIINDLVGNQTADLYREGTGCFDIETTTWTDTCAIPGYTAYFKQPTDWAAPNAYFWNTSPSEVTNVNWPGEAMTALGEINGKSWFSYQLPNGVEASNVIFNDGSGNQTSDLYREGNGCFTQDSGWSDSCDIPTPGMTVYFYQPDGWADNTNVYYWDNPDAPSWPGIAMESLGDGWFGFTFPLGVTSSNLIFNDGNGNQTTDLYQENGGCYGEFLEQGIDWRNSCILPTQSDSVSITNVAAHWLTAETLTWQVSDSRASEYRLYYSTDASISTETGAVTGDDGFVTMTNQGALSTALQSQNPHLSTWPSYQLADTSNIGEMLKGQLVATALDASGNLLEATYVQIPRVLDDVYAYSGNLGVRYSGGTPSVNLWAPTAQTVALIIYDSAGVEQSRHNANSITNGTYEFTGDASWNKQYYRFAISVYHPVSNQIEHYEVTDPYAVSLSENSQMSQFLDLAGDNSLKPTNWDAIVKTLPAHKDISLYEGHVRDFSQNDNSVPQNHRGKYMAFSHNGIDGATQSNGMSHLKSLQQAGLTHFHLLPIFDIASVDEDETKRVDLDDAYSRLCALSEDTFVQSKCSTAGETSIRDVLTELQAADATTADIQSITTAMANIDSFNWGYDPLHFNAPEGSYATATDGVTRVLEFREMVKALDEVNLNLVMDVVYNHTSASGLWNNSVLDRVVPGYYHRLNPISGSVENSTCCDNTATEHKMMEKLMVDTLVSWAKHFKVDSFRFDLMGHIPKSAMQAAQAALSTLTAATDGVNGENIYLYGEGWNFGEVAGNQRFEQATQFNMAGTGIGTFNDRMRSAVRGGNFTDSGRSQGWTSGNELFPNGYATGGNLNDQADRIRIGLTGNLQNYVFEDNGGTVNTGVGYGSVGYALDPQESVNYVDKHDNESLWDNTQAKLPDSMSAADRVRVHMLSTALINYGQGVPFYQMGTDLLRSKSLDRNSYNSGDWFNEVDFSATSKWAAGLPPAQDNQSRWTTMSELINNGNIHVSSDMVNQAHALFKEQLAVRYSSPLFRMDSSDEVTKRVGFHNTGSSQVSGLIAMTLSDGVCAGQDIDPNYDGVLVLFNADDSPANFTQAGTEGSQLHPTLINSSDPAIQSASVDGNTYTVAAHSAAVFVKPQGDAQGNYPCNPHVGTENQPGMTVYFQNTNAWTNVNAYYWNTSPTEATSDWPGVAMANLGSIASSGTDWYSLQLPNGVSAANIIFNDGAGNQTSDLYRENDGCFDLTSNTWSDSCTLPGLKLNFKAPTTWTADVNIYYWNAQDSTGNEAQGVDWPGVAMTYIGNEGENAWYTFQMPDGIRASNLIFNNSAEGGTGEQTSDLSRSANGCYVFDSSSWQDSCELPAN